MTVQELIEKLKLFSPDTVVVTRGFDEEGFADVRAVNPIQIQMRQLVSAREMIGEYENLTGEADIIDAILVDHSK